MRHVIIEKDGERQQIGASQLAGHEKDGWKLVRRTTVHPPEHADCCPETKRWIVDEEKKAAAEHSNELMNQTEREWRVLMNARVAALEALVVELTKKV